MITEDMKRTVCRFAKQDHVERSPEDLFKSAIESETYLTRGTLSKVDSPVLYMIYTRAFAKARAERLQTFMINWLPNGDWHLDEPARKLLIEALRGMIHYTGGEDPQCRAWREAIRALEGAPAFDTEVRRA